MRARRLLFSVVLIAGLVCSSRAALAGGSVGSADTATADPNVARPATKPCVVKLFSGTPFADFTPKTFAYTPPAGCAGPYEKVVLEADFAVSAGRQYDRTATLFLGGANIYFGTTMEPSKTVAPTWHVERDLTDYGALFGKSSTGRVEIGNLVDGTYTGVITGSAALYFYPARRPDAAPRSADVVLPLAAGLDGGTVALVTPSSRLVKSFILPRNIERAYLDVTAQSQSGDEFFYTCVPSDVADQLQSCSGTAFREAQITIDGQPAGVAPIYPWIFTGAIDPYLWRPIPSVQTLNFKPYRVDLTPFAALLSNGKSHEVAISVFNANNYFSTTATLLLHLDRGATQVTGGVLLNTLHASPSPTVNKSIKTAMDGSITGTVNVGSTRRFVIIGHVQTSHGRVVTEVKQDIHFSNRQTFDIDAENYAQRIDQKTSVLSVVRTLSLGLWHEATQRLSWPLQLDYSYVTNADKTSAQTTSFRQRHEQTDFVSVNGLPSFFKQSSNYVAPTDTLTYDAAGKFVGNRDQKSEQDYFSADSSGGCYSRAVRSEKGIVTEIRDGRACGP